MSFKFTLLGIEFSKNNKKLGGSMSRKRTTSQRKKFSKAVKKCHKATTTKEAFGSCMRKELKK